MKKNKQRTFGYEKKGKLPVEVYKALRSTGAQPATLY